MGITFALGGIIGLALSRIDMELLSNTVLYGILGIGIATIFVTFLAASGMSGNDGSSRRNLKIYILLVTIIFLVQIVIGYIAVKDDQTVEVYMRNKWVSSAGTVKSDVQGKFSCCGFANNTDLAYKDGGDAKCVPGNVNPGCYGKLLIVQQQYSTSAMVGCFSLLFIEIACVLSGLTILFSGKSEDYYTGKSDF